MSLGVYFALKAKDATNLFDAAGDEEALEVLLEEMEEEWDEAWLLEVDKAWDALHRCLTNGSLSFESLSPLHQCVLGGRQLYPGEDCIVSFLDSENVKNVAAVIQPIDETWMRQKYEKIPPESYPDPLSEDDFQYIWTTFTEVKTFYRKAARYNRAVIFTAQ
jgi:hypothetical protein